MKIKKLLAGVAAAALTVTSLAVVNVSADDVTKTYNLVGEKGKIKFTYENSVNIRGGIAPYEGWVDEEGNEAEEYLFKNTGELYFTYAAADDGLVELYHGDLNVDAATIAAEADINAKYLSKVTVGKGLYIEVTGLNAKGNTVVAKANAKVENGKELINVLKKGDDKKILDGWDLDLIDMVLVKSIKVKEDFEVNIGDYKLNSSGLACKVCPGGDLKASIDNWEGWKLSAWWAPVTGETYKTGGRNVTVGMPYGFGGVLDDTHTLVINGGNLNYKDFGYNTLRWINDNIEQNKGAVLRINFMTPAQSSALNAIIGTGSDSYITDTDIGAGEWDVPVLTPGHSSSTTVTEEDIAIAVNIKNTSRLQLTGNINTEDKNNMYVDFDWDKLVQNSAATIAGNVDSIHFRVLNTANVRNNLEPTGANYVGIKSIQILVPDQTTIPGGNTNWESKVVTVTDENSGVGAELTNKALTGNGGTIIKATGTLTTNKLTYDVKLLDKDGNFVQPAGDVTLTLPIPKDMQGLAIKNNVVTHYKHDGGSEQLAIINKDTYKTDNYVKIVTSSFSGFEIEFENTDAATTEPEETKAPETQAPVTTEAPVTSDVAGNVGGQTGDKTTPATGFAIAIVPAAIAAAAAVVAKKRK